MFEIKITEDFKKQLDNLSVNKKAVLNAKISFLKNTGLLGNCKTLGNNIFEYKLEGIKDNVYFHMNNDSSILFFSNLDNSSFENNQSTIVDWLEYNKELLKDIRYSKLYYNEIYILYKQTDEEIFFMNELKNIFKMQKDNFKKITNLNPDYIINSINNNQKEITTLDELKNKLNFIIKIKSMDYLVEKTKIEKEEIEKILKVKENINLNGLIKLMRL